MSANIYYLELIFTSVNILRKSTRKKNLVVNLLELIQVI